MPNGCAVEWRECAATRDPRRALSLPEQAAGLRAISAVVAQSALSLAKLATLHCEERKERPMFILRCNMRNARNAAVQSTAEFGR
jgi:hypothetical protein